jgi:pantothenate kinase
MTTLVSTKLKFAKVLKQIHRLKLKKLNDSVMFHELSDIYIGIELLLDTYINQQLVDRTMSAQNRKSFGYLKHIYKTKQENKTKRST